VDVVLLLDVILVHHVGEYPLGGVGSLQQIHETRFEIMAEICQELVGLVGEKQELPLMRFTHSMTFEAVLVPALFLTHLAVPTQLLKSLGLHLVGQVFWRSDLGLRHLGV